MIVAMATCRKCRRKFSLRLNRKGVPTEKDYPHCGYAVVYPCWSCGCRFSPFKQQTRECRCGWFACPKCDSCYKRCPRK